ncbi:hypothetical protein [Ensifer adhaerens]|jgi:hypothetical protein|uniref:hypothetical protein n=1 Tax=Ensifer adhaerens TaxID=106592 RepID=UPI0020302A6F|nr:hypothetical protein [Ensifer adhaerens]
MKEIDRLIAQLFPAENGGSKVLDLKFFPGEQAVTVEEFCKEVHAAFVQVDSGQSHVSASYPEELSPVHVDRFLATA